MDQAKTSKKLKDIVDLDKLQNLGAIDIIGLTDTFKKLTKGLKEGDIDIPKIQTEGKSQGKIILDTFHDISEIQVIGAMKRFGMNVKKSLSIENNETDLNLASNFLILATKPSNFIDILPYPDLAKVVSAFKESLSILREKGIVKPMSNADKYASHTKQPLPGDKGSKWADFVMAPKEQASTQSIAQ